MTSVLSLFMTLVMMLSGSAATPGAPEISHVTKLSGISVEVGDDTYSIDDTLTFISTLRNDEFVTTFSVDESDTNKMPIAFSVNSDCVRLSINDHDHYYEIPSDYIDELTGFDNESLTAIQTMLTTLEPAIRYAISLNNNDSLISFTGSLIESFVECAETYDADSPVEINGQAALCDTYTLNLTPANLCRVLDAMRSGENAELAGALDGILAFLSTQYGETVENFESLAANASEEEIPMTLTIAANEDGTVRKTTIDIYDEEAFSFRTEILVLNNQLSLILNLDDDSEVSHFNYSYNVSLTESSENTYDVAGYYLLNDTEDYSLYNEDYTQITGTASDTFTFEMNLNGKISDGLASLSADGSITTGSTAPETSDSTVKDLSIPFNLNIVQTANTDNGIDTAYRLSLSNIDSVGNISINFTIGNGEIGYSEPFSGEPLIIDESSGSNAQTMMTWTSDLLGFTGDALDVLSGMLPEDFDLSTLELDQLIGMMMGQSDDTYDDMYDDISEITYTDYETFADAGEAELGAQLPEIITPEGYSLYSITGVGGNVYADYYSDTDDGYVQLSFQSYENAESEISPAFFYNEDGTVWCADFPFGNAIYVSAYFNDMHESDVRTLLNEMGFEFR